MHQNQILEALGGEFMFFDRKLEKNFYKQSHPRSQNAKRRQYVKE